MNSLITGSRFLVKNAAVGKVATRAMAGRYTDTVYSAAFMDSIYILSWSEVYSSFFISQPSPLELHVEAWPVPHQ